MKVDVAELIYHLRTECILGRYLLRGLLKTTFIIGANQLVIALVKLIEGKLCARFRYTIMAESGESGISNAAANGCISRSCFVSVLYSFDAASDIAVKVVAEVGYLLVCRHCGSRGGKKGGVELLRGLVVG